MSTAQILNRLLDVSNKAEFKACFTGDHHDTLPYIFEVRKFNRINQCSDESVKFARVFNTIPPHFQNRFMRKVPSIQTLTIARLETWIMDSFPPPQTKYQFIITLKLIRMRFNESPLLVYERFLSKLHQVNEAITLLNGRTGAVQIPAISAETKIDILTNIFIRQNDRDKPAKGMKANNGALNKLVVRYIAKNDPTGANDWIELFKKMKNELIPSVLSTLPEYQFQVYPPSPHDDDIYLNQNDITTPRQPTYVKDQADKPDPSNKYGPNGRRGRGRGRGGRGLRGRGYTPRGGYRNGGGWQPYNTRGGYRGRGRGNRNNYKRRGGFFARNGGPPSKRQKYGPSFCTRCRRTNHNIDMCRAFTDVNNKPLRPCSLCGRNNHNFSHCRDRNVPAKDTSPNENDSTNSSTDKSLNVLTKAHTNKVMGESFQALSNGIMNDKKLTSEQQHDRCALLLDWQEDMNQRLRRA
eukprot:909071_1